MANFVRCVQNLHESSGYSATGNSASGWLGRAAASEESPARAFFTESSFTSSQNTHVFAFKQTDKLIAHPPENSLIYKSPLESIVILAT